MDPRALTETIRRLAVQALQGSDVVVDDVTVHQAGRRRLVRVFLARDLASLSPDDHTSPVEPLTLDEVADATRTVSDALDDAGTMGTAPYTLEVSSSGLDRPLTTPEQFRRNVGRLVRLTLADGATTTDRLAAVGAGTLTLHGGSDDIPLDQVTKGVVQVEFNRADGKDA